MTESDIKLKQHGDQLAADGATLTTEQHGLVRLSLHTLDSYAMLDRDDARALAKLLTDWADA